MVRLAGTRRPVTHPPTRTLLALALAAALAASGCARPAQKAPVLSAVRSKNLSEDDVKFAKELLDSQREISVAGQSRRTFETTTLPDLTAARQLFPGALFPRDTLGRGMVTVIYRRAVVPGALPRETLFLAYSGRLLISESPAFRLRIRPAENPTREETMVAGAQGTVEFSADQTVVSWDLPTPAGGFRYRVASPSLTKEEAVHIARSMAP